MYNARRKRRGHGLNLSIDVFSVCHQWNQFINFLRPFHFVLHKPLRYCRSSIPSNIHRIALKWKYTYSVIWWSIANHDLHIFYRNAYWVNQNAYSASVLVSIVNENKNFESSCTLLKDILWNRIGIWRPHLNVRFQSIWTMILRHFHGRTVVPHVPRP